MPAEADTQQQTRKARAFVISPIGGYDERGRDPRRAYADSVFDKLILPACSALAASGYEVTPVRGDHDTEELDIVERFVKAINDDDLVIALLSEGEPGRINANVFYEVGIAHAAGRPVILLMRDGQVLPFDLHGKNAILYHDAHVDGSADPRLAGGPIHNLTAEMKRRLDKKHFYERPFGRDISLGRQGVRNRQNSVDFSEWSSIILDARREIYFAGTTLHWLATDKVGSSFVMPRSAEERQLLDKAHLATLLADRVAHGVDVTIMMSHPDNPVLQSIPTFTNAKEHAGRVAALRKEAAESYRLWTIHRDDVLRAIKRGRSEGRAPDGPPGQFRVIQVSRGAILQRMFATENRAFLTPNLYHMQINTTPCMDARPDGETDKYNKAAHAYILDDLRHLAKVNEVGASAGWWRLGAKRAEAS
jgi:hypothetical protein